MYMQKNFVSILMGLVCSMVLVLSIGQTSAVEAAKPKPVESAPVVGIVDYLYLVDHHPGAKAANDILQAEEKQARAEYAEQSVDLSQDAKQELDHQLVQRLEQKRLDLLNPISRNIDETIKSVADSKQLSIVVDKNVAVYGGIVITDDVLAKLTTN